MKKKAAIAMSLMTVAGSVVPAFANETEIVGVPRTSFDLDHLKSDNDKIRVQAEKDLEATKKQIEELVAQKDSNGNNVYEVKVEEKVDTKINGETGETVVDEDGIVMKFLYTTVTFKRVDNVNTTEEDKVYVFVKEAVDYGFGQEVPVQPVTINASKEELKLGKMIYDMSKNKDKFYTSVEENRKAYIVDVYLLDHTKIAQLTINGKEAAKKVVKVSGQNDFVGHWAEEKIVEGMLNKVVDNSTKFRPDEDITRAEFAKIACAAYGIDANEYLVDEKDHYSDVNRYEWYAKYEKALTEAGIVSGDGNGTFRPNDKITREEAAVIIATAVSGHKQDRVTTDVNGNRVHRDIVTGFSDDAKISNWADESVQYLMTAKITEGYKVSDEIANEFRPANNISRAESLVMMTRNAVAKN